MNATTDATPAKQSRSRAVGKWEDFEHELISREQSIAALLPTHVSKQRFMSSAIAAVKQNPDLLTATPRSLFAAVTKSAQDGLLPDGREGVITIYREKQKDNSYQIVAQWNPMTFGLRKRGRELDGVIVNAQVVYENDHFMRHEGDDPKIEHNPAQLGTTRGKMIGAYAIWRNDSGILHREVMDADQIATVRAQSKAPESLMWKKFTEEAWRKTVVRRGFKSVPCSEKLEAIVKRDDDLFNFDADGSANTDKPKLKVIQAAADGERKALPPIVGEEAEATEANQAPDTPEQVEPSSESTDWRQTAIAKLAECTDAESLFSINREVIYPAKGNVSDEDWQAVALIYRQTFDRLSMSE